MVGILCATAPALKLSRMRIVSSEAARSLLLKDTHHISFRSPANEREEDASGNRENVKSAEEPHENEHMQLVLQYDNWHEIWIILLAAMHLEKWPSSGEPWLRSEKHAELGTEVLLPCVLKSPQCEGLHSIKWYRGPTRIFIFSEDAGIIRGSNDIAIRADIEYSTNSSKTYLKIPGVKLKDEGLYKCEATYMAVNRECNNVQHIILNVTGKLTLHYATLPLH
ncbi:hypothetical protein EAI_05298 [Harpegnathos saltator]|uniref:Ig-like domain-containing protein n=1 Tax=Harpegnathos saltator TaxID=610380 RepID=E2BPP8_HARSA|nr:hypothetical protein EAI_05298 [Harpegnathos saltator]